jgi:hypothetical protein
MTVEIFSGKMELTFRQRWSHYIAMLFAGLGLLIGINLRESTLNVTTLYTNPQAGISAQYPQNWLLEEGGADFIFRVRDTATPGHNTSIQVAVRPIGSETSPRNIFDSLTLARAQTLAKYEVISEEPFILPDETVTSAMTYVFVASPTNPFLQNIPVVVEGIDILLIERGQAIIVTFLSSADSFESNLPILQEFLRNLEF